MSTLTSCDLDYAIRFSHRLSLENLDATIVPPSEIDMSDDVEQLNANLITINEDSNWHATVQDSEVTLESLVGIMEDSILAGGLSPQAAQLANVSLESISHKFNINPNSLAFGLEAGATDSESETQSTLDRAKQMLGALKSNMSSLVGKMFVTCLAALGNVAAMSAKLQSRARNLKASINRDNTGGNGIKLGKGMRAKLSLDGTTPLQPPAYVNEFKRAIDKYENVVNTYANTDVLKSFIEHVAGSKADRKANLALCDLMAKNAESISKDITKSTKDDGTGIEVKQSAPYLGGAVITSKRPAASTLTSIVDALMTTPVKNQVSQEAKPHSTSSVALRYLGGGLLWAMGGYAFIDGALTGATGGITLAAGVMSGSAAILTGGAVLLGISTLLFFISSILRAEGGKLISEGSKMRQENRASVNDSVNRVGSAVTSFDVSSTSISSEADETDMVTSLNSKQVLQIADIIERTTATTKVLTKELDKRKALIPHMTRISKAISDSEGKGTKAERQATSAAQNFVTQFIKNTVNFEVQLTSYALSVMRAGMEYAEQSNRG